MVPQAKTRGNPPLPHSAPFATPLWTGVVTAQLRAALAPLWQQPADRWGQPGSGLSVVKRSSVRTVLHGTLGDGLQVHVKLFLVGRLSDRARDALLGSRADRELRHLLAARALGLPAVEPLAAAASAQGATAHSCLVTRSVPHAQPFTFSAPAATLRRVGELLARAHDAGVLAPDLHPGNIVLDAEHSPWLLDLTAMRHTGLVDLAQRARALAFFCQSLDAGPLDPSAGELLAAYLRAGAALPPAFRPLLARAHRQVRLHALVAFGRRSSRACRHTQLSTDHPARWFVHRPHGEDPSPELLAACRAFASAPPTPHKTGRRGAVWLLPDLVIKARAASKAAQLFRAHYWLLFAGVPAAAPVALRLRIGQGLMFARRLPGTDLARELAARPLPARAAVRSAAHLGQAIGRLHAHGLRNRDLKFDNLLRDPNSGVVSLFDLDGIRRKRPSDTRGQGQDLGRLFAAFAAAGEPGGALAVRAFLRGYARARRRLLQPGPLPRLLRVAALRAQAWASAHR
ncbi:MAG TPA: lipopolysaccharide kinase InaA family protein [Planctomycetota bacterium]|nr:lipopolysaccharide kinase InaA family protein [Planctomycetota bacterium]